MYCVHVLNVPHSAVFYASHLSFEKEGFLEFLDQKCQILALPW